MYPSIPWLPSDEEEEDSQLAEVLPETHKLLTVACRRSVSNELRKRTQGRYKLPMVEVTKTPSLDPVIKTLATQRAKAVDKELAKLQTFVLDSLAPLTAILEYGYGMSVEEVREASSTAVELLGNANAQISRLRRDKLVSSINKNFVPLEQEDSEFAAASPNLFGLAFSKRAKE